MSNDFRGANLIKRIVDYERNHYDHKRMCNVIVLVMVMTVMNNDDDSD